MFKRFILFLALIGLGVFQAHASEVTIDSTVNSTRSKHSGASSTVVFVSDQVGYAFYVDSSGECVYRKTADAGSSWGSVVVFDSQTDCLGVAVWYDQWTPGNNTGTQIHILTWDSGDSDLWYTQLDTSTDTVTTPVATSSSPGPSKGGSFAVGSNYGTITEGTDGVVYVGMHNTGDSYVLKCSSSCSSAANWSEAGTKPFSKNNDGLLLMPLASGNLIAMRWHVSTETIQSKVYTASSNTWSASWTDIDTTAEDNTSYDVSFGATVDKTTNKIYLVYVDYDTSGSVGGGDDDIKTAVYDGSSWTAKTDVLTNTSDGVTGAKIGFDEISGTFYVVYTARTTASKASTGRAYYRTSTDGMTTWSAASSALNTTSGDLRGARLNLMSGERLHATWNNPDGLYSAGLTDPIPPTVTLDSTSSSGDESSAAQLALSLSSAVSQNVTVHYTITAGTATSGDYTSSSGTATVAAGSTTGTLSVPIDDDSIDENDETFQVTISSPAYATLGTNTVHTYTITDNDGPPTLAVSDVTVDEGAGTATVSVTMTGSSSLGDTTVNYTTIDGTSFSGSDYTSTSGSLTWTTGETGAKTFTITLLDDAFDESEETIGVTLSGVSNGSITDDTGIVTITDNDSAPTLSVGDVTVDESAGTATVSVSISGLSSATVSVSYAATDGSATASSDYTASSGNLTWASGDTADKTFTIPILDDSLDETNETVVVSLSGASNATLLDDTGLVTLTDNDATPTLTINDVSVDEATGSATLTVSLTGLSGSTVSVAYFTTDGSAVNGSDYVSTVGTLTWSSGDTGDKTFTVTVLDDSEDEEEESFNVHLSSASNATLIDATGAVTLTDNDSAGITVEPSGGSTNVTEGSSSVDTLIVVLATAPSSPVTVTVTPSDDVSIDTTTLTFDSTNWNVVQTVSVSAVDDDQVEGAHSASLSFNVTSSDTHYDGFTLSSLAVQVTDNDSAGVSIIESSGATSVTEGGAGDTYTVVLTSEPSADVTIDMTPDSQVLSDVDSLVFTSTNWNIAQTVTVSAVDDARIEGNHSGVLSHTVSSDDSDYDAISANSVIVSIVDNDFAGVSVSETDSSTQVTEGSSGDSYTLVLTSEPLDDVTVQIQTDAQTTTDVSSVIFTSSDWNVPQTVTVSAVDDTDVEATHSSTITHTVTSTDTDYEGLSVAHVTVTVIDNDIPSLSIDNVSVDESTGTATITVTMTGISDSTVTVDYATVDGTAHASSDYTAVNGTLTWAPGESGEHTFEVPLTDDTLDETDENFSITLSNESGAALLNNSALVTLVDDDSTPTLSFAATSSSGDEASSPVNIVINLSAASGEEVTVDYAVTGGSASASDYSLSSGTITIPAGDTAATLSLDIVDDALAESSETVEISLSNPTQASLGTDLIYTYTIADNDSFPSLSISDVSVNESAGNATVTVSMSGSSGSLVSVDYATADGTASAGSDYTSTNGSLVWNSGETGDKTFVVSLLDDSISETDETIVISLSNISNASLSDASSVITMIDDETAPTVSFSSTDSSAAESESSSTFTVTLSGVSSRDVTVNYDASGTASSSSDYTLSSSSITIPAGFTSASFSLTIDNDGVDESDETVVFTLSSAVGATLGSVTSVTYTILDDDTAGITILPSGGSTHVTEGDTTSDTYTVVLNSEPLDDVTVQIDDGTQLLADQISLTFTPENWNVVQTISVLAVDDDVAEGTQSVSITNTVTSSDPLYDGIGADSIDVDITDNDTAAVSVTETAGSTQVTEGGSADSYSFVLTSAPTAAVNIDLTTDAQLSLDITTLTFDSTNWNVPQTVTVSAVDDDVAEGNDISSIGVTVSGADSVYDNFAVALGDVQITDNDTAGVSVTETGGTTEVTEGSTSDTYSVVLTSQPLADVTIAINEDAQANVDVHSLTFTSINWNVPQTVTVSAIDDEVVEGNHAGTLTMSIATTDTNYDGLTINSLTVSLIDNDTAGVSLVQSGGSTEVTEGGGTDSYTLVLTSQPTSTVTVSFSIPSELQLNVSSVVFDSSNWNVPQTVTVTAVDDTTVQGDRSATITHSVSSTDLDYNALGVSDVLVSVIDNDTSDPGSGGSTGGGTTGGGTTGGGTTGGSTGGGTGGTTDPGTNVPVVANAGVDQTVIAGSRVALDGSSSEGSHLVYQWEIVSGDGTLSDENTATPTLVVSNTASDDIQILLTVVDDADQEASDTLVLHVVASTITSTELSEGVVAVYNTLTIREAVADQTVTLSFKDVSIQLPPGQTNYVLAVTTENRLAIGLPQMNNGRGAVYVSHGNLNTLSGSYVLSGNEASFSVSDAHVGSDISAIFADANVSNSSFDLFEGLEEGDGFGSYIDSGDLEGDGEEEIVVVAPHASTDGVAYVLGETLQAVLTGSSSSPLHSVYLSDLLSASHNDDFIFVPDNRAFNLNLKPQPLLTTSEKTASVFMLLGDQGNAGSQDFSSADMSVSLAGGSSYHSMATGDANGDGQEDVVVVEDDGSLSLYFGPFASGADLSSQTPDVVVSSDQATSSFGLQISIGDVSGDGMGDLVIGDAGYGSFGVLYVIFGSAQWDNAIDLDNNAHVLTITGDNTGDGIGSDFELTDNDQDGVDEIYAVTQSGRVHRFNLQQATTSQATGGSGSSGGCSLQLHSPVVEKVSGILSIFVLTALFFVSRKRVFKNLL